MSMIKFISPAGWDFDRPIAVPVKVSSRGLIGADRQEFIKTASHVFLPMLDSIKFAKDEYPIHTIAIGAHEFYGANRNGDGFPEAVCRQFHPTFTKFARYFRNHRNKPEKGHPHFGIIKASAYNEKMRRVELLLALNAEKSACERNGGFVADRELEKLARGEDLPGSMACRVPHDECSWCHNLARTRKDYCTAEKCAAGGCKDNLTRMVKVAGDIHHLHVINHRPTFFDWSGVFRPAERIAYGATADYLTKAAADNGLFELADMIKMSEDATAPLEVMLYQDGLPGEWSTAIAAQIKLAYALATCERQEKEGSAEMYRAFADGIQPPFPVEVLDPPGTEKAAVALNALAEKKIILPLRDFARWTGKEDLAKAAADRLPGIYQRMLDDESLERRVEQNKYRLLEKVAGYQVRNSASFCRFSHSLDRECVRDRGMLSAMRNQPLPNPKTGFEKSAADNLDAEQLARDYAVYKVAALQRIAAFDNEFPLTARLAVRQNHVY